MKKQEKAFAFSCDNVILKQNRKSENRDFMKKLNRLGVLLTIYAT